MRVPEIGDLVHYVTKGLLHRPAFVTGTYLNGQGYLISVMALKPDGLAFHQMIDYDEAGALPETWHWPEGKTNDS